MRLSILVWLLSVLSMGKGAKDLEITFTFLMSTSMPQCDSLFSFGVPTISITDSLVKSLINSNVAGSVSAFRARVCISPVLSLRMINLILLRFRTSCIQPWSITSLLRCLCRSWMSVRSIGSRKRGGFYMVFGWIYIPLFVSFSYDQQTNEKRRSTFIRGID